MPPLRRPRRPRRRATAAARLACAAALATCAVLPMLPAQPADAALYWVFRSSSVVGNGAIGRVDVDGSHATQELIHTDQGVLQVATNSTYVYWSSPYEGRIGRARLDGSDVQNAFVATGGTPQGLAVDDDHVYWGDADTDTIRRADADTGAIDAATTFSVATGGDPYALALDAAHLYWVSVGATSSALGRATRAGADVIEPLGSGINPHYGLAVDGDQLLFSGSNMLGRAGIDGSGATNEFIAAEAGYRPMGVAVHGDRVYWIHYYDTPMQRGIYSADATDGSDRAELIGLDDNVPSGLADGPPLGRLAAGAAPTFPDAIVGQAGEIRTITFSNDGERAVQAGDVTLTGAGASQFEVTADDCASDLIARDAQCTVQVRFAPDASGTHEATLQLASDANDGPRPTTVALSATALDPATVAFGDPPTFADQLVGTAGPEQTVTITNGGDVDLHISAITLAGADAAQFALGDEGCSAAPIPTGGSCDVTIRFAPAMAGHAAATLHVVSDAPSSPDELALSAVALAPEPTGPSGPSGPGPQGPSDRPDGGASGPPAAPGDTTPPADTTPPHNAAPVAIARAKRRSRARTRVQRFLLDARRSHDADGSIVAYRWRIGSRTVGTRARKRVRLRARKRPYVVRLTVTDAAGASTSTRLRLRVRLPRKVSVAIPASITFPTDSSYLDGAAKRLVRHLRPLAAGALRVTITGRSDNVGPAGYNRWLSDRRAHRVAAALLHGIHRRPARVIIRSVGPANPLAPNTTAAGRAVNRSVQLVIVTRRRTRATVSVSSARRASGP